MRAFSGGTDAVMKTPCAAHRAAAVEWARRVLAAPGAHVILDTETTGLAGEDEIIEIAVLSPSGDLLLNERVRPARARRISPFAEQVHHIRLCDLADRPTLGGLAGPLRTALEGKTIIAYNAVFDRRMYFQSFQAGGGYWPEGEWECAMKQYARFVGEWNESRGDYRWHRLQGGDHSAAGDCRAVLSLIRAMAGGQTAAGSPPPGA